MIYGKSGKASSSVLRPALLYISSQAVIPAKAGIPSRFYSRFKPPGCPPSRALYRAGAGRA